MKFISSCKLGFALLGLIGALCSANVARATAYTVNLDTAAIAGNAAGPFYLDFQSIYGSGSAQVITLSNFLLTGGGFVNGTEFAIGAVAGDLASALVLSPDSSNFYNEFFQQFEASVTHIRFDLDIVGGASGATPTSFAVSLLDGTDLFAIPTTGFADTLVMFDIDGANTTFATASSTGATAGATASVSVPDTSLTLLLLLGGLAAMGVMRRRHALAA